MKFANANKLHRKSGGSPHQSFDIHIEVRVTPRVKAFEKTIFNPRTLSAGVGLLRSRSLIVGFEVAEARSVCLATPTTFELTNLCPT